MGRSTVLDSGEVLAHHHHMIGENRHSTYAEEDGYGWNNWVVYTPCVWPRYYHHTFICHKYHVNHTCKQCNLDRLNKIGSVFESRGFY